MDIIRRWSNVLIVAISALSLSGCLLKFGESYGTDVPGGDSSFLVEADATVEPCTTLPSFAYDCIFGADGYNSLASFGFIGISGAVLYWLDPVILQVPAGMSDVSGTFAGPASGNLSITTVTGPLQADANRQIVPETGKKFLIIDFPGGVPPGGAGKYSFQFNFTVPSTVATPLALKVIFAAKTTVGTQTYYSPLLPCTTNMAEVPALTISTINMFTPINITPFKTQQGCNNMTYDLTSGGATPGTVSVVEYRNSDFDHYFVTPNLSDIQLLDNKTPPFQAWSRTGRSFKAYPSAGAPAASVAVCRFFNSNFGSKSSHFFALHGFGCEDTINRFPDWTLENENYFNTMLPDANSACAAGTVPLYRLYNQGMGGAPNHRFVTALSDQQDMVTQGWAAEGVVMCLPP